MPKHEKHGLEGGEEAPLKEKAAGAIAAGKEDRPQEAAEATEPEAQDEARTAEARAEASGEQAKDQAGAASGAAGEPAPEEKPARQESAAEAIAACEAEAEKPRDGGFLKERVIPAAEKKDGHFKFNFGFGHGKQKGASESDPSSKAFKEAAEAQSEAATSGRLAYLFGAARQKLRENFPKEKVKAALTSRRNIEAGFTGLAAVLSVIALARSGNEDLMDRNNAFARVTEISPSELGAGGAGSKAGEAIAENREQESANQAERDFNNRPGVIFRDEQEFKEGVKRAISEIRADENREMLARRMDKFKAAQESVPDKLKMYGNPNARFKIYEYSDFECPYCKSYWETPKQVADLSNGQVALVWKNFPLQFHQPAAGNEASALQCVYELKGNRAFWAAADRIFETTRSNGQGSPVLQSLYDEMGIDQNKYLECLNRRSTNAAVQKDAQEAEKAGIASTPTSVVIDTFTGRREVVPGAVPPEQLMNVIEQMNAQAADQGAGQKAQPQQQAQPQQPSAPGA